VPNIFWMLVARSQRRDENTQINLHTKHLWRVAPALV